MTQKSKYLIILFLAEIFANCQNNKDIPTE